MPNRVFTKKTKLNIIHYCVLCVILSIVIGVPIFNDRLGMTSGTVGNLRLQLLSSDDDEVIRALGFIASQRPSPELRKYIESHLSSGSAEIRYSAIRAIGKYDDPRTVIFLAKAKADQSMEVCEEVERQLDTITRRMDSRRIGGAIDVDVPLKYQKSHKICRTNVEKFFGCGFTESDFAGWDEVYLLTTTLSLPEVANEYLVVKYDRDMYVIDARVIKN